MATRKTFEQWMAEVDKAISQKLGGFNSRDLPDYDYAVAYEDGRSPSSVAKAAMRAAGDF